MRNGFRWGWLAPLVCAGLISCDDDGATKAKKPAAQASETRLGTTLDKRVFITPGADDATLAVGVPGVWKGVSREKGELLHHRLVIEEKGKNRFHGDDIAWRGVTEAQALLPRDTLKKMALPKNAVVYHRDYVITLGAGALSLRGSGSDTVAPRGAPDLPAPSFEGPLRAPGVVSGGSGNSGWRFWKEGVDAP